MYRISISNLLNDGIPSLDYRPWESKADVSSVVEPEKQDLSVDSRIQSTTVTTFSVNKFNNRMYPMRTHLIKINNVPAGNELPAPKISNIAQTVELPENNQIDNEQDSDNISVRLWSVEETQLIALSVLSGKKVDYNELFGEINRLGNATRSIKAIRSKCHSIRQQFDLKRDTLPYASMQGRIPKKIDFKPMELNSRIKWSKEEVDYLIGKIKSGEQLHYEEIAYEVNKINDGKDKPRTRDSCKWKCRLLRKKLGLPYQAASIPEFMPN